MSGHKYEVIFLPYLEGPWAGSDSSVCESFELKSDAVERAHALVRDALAEEAEVIQIKGSSLVVKVS